MSFIDQLLAQISVKKAAFGDPTPVAAQRPHNLSDMPAVHPNASSEEPEPAEDDPLAAARQMPGGTGQQPGEPRLPMGPATAKLAASIVREMFKRAEGLPPLGQAPAPAQAQPQAPAPAPAPAPVPGAATAKSIITTSNDPQKPLAGLQPKAPAPKHASFIDRMVMKAANHVLDSITEDPRLHEDLVAAARAGKTPQELREMMPEELRRSSASAGAAKRLWENNNGGPLEASNSLSRPSQRVTQSLTTPDTGLGGGGIARADPSAGNGMPSKPVKPSPVAGPASSVAAPPVSPAPAAPPVASPPPAGPRAPKTQLADPKWPRLSRSAPVPDIVIPQPSAARPAATPVTPTPVRSAATTAARPAPASAGPSRLARAGKTGLLGAGLASAAALGYGAYRHATAAPLPPLEDFQVPKAASFIDHLVKQAFMPPNAMFGNGMYGMPPTGQFPLGNPYGNPQQAYNNSFGMNPYQRAGGMLGGPGMMMAPHHAYQMMGSGGMSPYARMGMMGGPGMGMSGLGFPGMGGPLGGGRMTEDQLRDVYQQRRDMIEGMAGQMDPNTGRPYDQASISRQLNSLNANTTRALQNLRSVQQTYGSGPQHGAPPFGPMGMHMNGHMPMPYQGGGYSPMISPIFGGGNRSESSQAAADRSRAMLEDEQDRGDALRNRRESGEGSAVTRAQLEALQRRMQAAARATSTRASWSGSGNTGYTDPMTGAPVQFGGSILGSGELWGTDAFKDFTGAHQAYQDAHSRYQAAQQALQPRLQRASSRESALQRQQDTREREADEDRNSERQDSRQQRQLQSQAFQRMYGLGGSRPTNYLPPSLPPVQPQQPAATTPPGAPSSGGMQLAGPSSYASGFAPQASSRMSPSLVDELVATITANFDKRAGMLGNPLGRLAAMTGAGALAGSAAGAASAPVDYWPEAMLRGAGKGAVVGGSAGLGALAGGGAGKLTSLGAKHTLKSPTAAKAIEKVLPAAGAMAGGALAGGTALGASTGDVPPWESGELPYLERMDSLLRRRSPAPTFNKKSSVRSLVLEVIRQ